MRNKEYLDKADYVCVSHQREGMTILCKDIQWCAIDVERCCCRRDTRGDGDEQGVCEEVL